MQKLSYFGKRRSIGQYVRLAGSQSPVGINIEINAAGFREFCAEQNITYTPLLMKIIAGAAKKHPIMNAILGRDMLKQKIFVPEDVDIAVAIEKQCSGDPFVMTPVVRMVNKKTVTQLSAELEHLSALPEDHMPDFASRRLFNLLPGFMQHAVLKVICQSPSLFQKYFGTIGVSNLGMLGIIDFFPVWINTLAFGVGAIKEKPVAENGQILIAPVLHLALCFNHSVLDGAMAGRILAEIKRSIESQEYRKEL